MKTKFSEILVLAAGTLWGLMGIFVRQFNAFGLGSFEIAQLRITTGMVLVGLYLALFHREMFKVRLKDLWCFFGSGVISLLLFSNCYFLSMRYVSLSVASILLYTAPIIVMLLSVVLFKEKFSIVKVAALILAFLGCVLVSGLGTNERIPLIGLLLGLCAGFFYALYSIFGRLVFLRGYGSWTLIFYTFLFCALGGAPFVKWGKIAAVASQSHAFLPWTVLMAVATAFLPYLLYSMGLSRMESGKASILASIEPVVSTLVSVFVFHEGLSKSGAAGILLVLSAVVILSLPKLPRFLSGRKNTAA